MKKNRAYKKDGAFKDATLIVIACEGEKTEPYYFSFFEQIEPRKCKIEVLKQEDGKKKHNSSPNWLIQRIQHFIQANDIGEGDALFIVSDVDRWKKKLLYEVEEECEALKNVSFILSNPCFEVWLYYHLGSPKTETATTSKQWKAALHRKAKSGFVFQKFVGNIEKAIANSKNDDANPNHFFPVDKHTKVYKLLEAIIKKIGKPYWNNFVKNIVDS
jgi:hypothetical protein